SLLDMTFYQTFKVLPFVRTVTSGDRLAFRSGFGPFGFGPFGWHRLWTPLLYSFVMGSVQSACGCFLQFLDKLRRGDAGKDACPVFEHGSGPRVLDPVRHVFLRDHPGHDQIAE